MTSRKHPLRGYIGMVLYDVHDHELGVVAEVGPAARLGRRLVLLEGCTSTSELDAPEPWSDGDESQLQADIGDEMYEQERYSEHEIDIVPDEPVFPWRPDQ